MNNAEFENKMFHHVNENCRMKELNRQEIERAAAEEYQVICKCKKVNAVIGIIVLTVCFATIVFAVQAMTLTGILPAAVAIGVMAVVGLVFGMVINFLGNRIKK